MKKKILTSLLLAGAVVATSATAGKPAKPPKPPKADVTSPAAPVIVDAAGAVVGPVVPLRDGTRIAAAVYRFQGNSVKAFFDVRTYASRQAAASDSALHLVGAVPIMFPNNFSCDGQGYVDHADLSDANAVPRPVGEDLKGYAAMLLVAAWPAAGLARPAVVSVDWTQPAVLPGFSGSALLPDGTCTINPALATTKLDGVLYPVSLAGATNFTGPYGVE